MKKGKQITLAFVVAAILGGAAFLLSKRSNLARPNSVRLQFALTGVREPIYQGKPLDSWILDYRSPEPVYRDKAVAMVQLAGTNAISTLVRMLEVRDPIKRGITDFWNDHISRTVPKYVPSISNIHSGIYKAAAANACADLGDKAKPAVPALTGLLKSQDAYVRSAATAALKRIDPVSAAKAGVQ